MLARAWLIGLAIVIGGFLSPTFAQTIPESPILVIDFERLFTQSAPGREALEDLEARSSDLQEKSDQISKDLADEERDLTEKRDTLSVEVFRELAEAFDEKVQSARSETRLLNEELSEELASIRADFRTKSAVVLAAVMTEANAALIIERKDVYLINNAVDVTDVTIVRINMAAKAGEFKLLD